MNYKISICLINTKNYDQFSPISHIGFKWCIINDTFQTNNRIKIIEIYFLINIYLYE